MVESKQEINQSEGAQKILDGSKDTKVHIKEDSSEKEEVQASSADKEEIKMTNETKKILDEKIQVTATCVRVPVRTGHSESINIEFEKSYDLENIIKILDKAPGCKVIDDRKDGGYITPLEAENDYTTYISRIRKDNTNPKAINIWVVSDNLLKGAALNTVQIAECLMKKL